MTQKLNYTILIAAILLLGFSGCGENEVTVPPLTQDNPVAATINSGATHTFTLAPATGGQGTIMHQWQSSTDNTAWVDISGATSPNFTTPALTTNTYFRRQATAGDATIISAAALVTVTIPDYVTILNVRWATRNVDLSTTSGFANNPEGAGMFFQWNRSTGWSSTGPLQRWNPFTASWENANWNPTNATGDNWIPANDPCPRGWRVPTRAELESLKHSSVPRAWINDWSGTGVNGLTFGTIPNQLFLPAAGRQSTNGTLHEIGIRGNYWSNTPGVINPITTGSGMSLTSSGGFANGFDLSRSNGFSVRCVKE